MRKVLGLGFLTLAVAFMAAATLGASANAQTSSPTTTPTVTPTGSVMGATTTPGAPATGFGY